MKKYEFTDETRKINNVLLHRIKRLLGRLIGGWIKSEKNLSQEDDCLAIYNVCVFETALVSGDACVYYDAWLSNEVSVFGDVIANGDSSLGGGSCIKW